MIYKKNRSKSWNEKTYNDDSSSGVAIQIGMILKTFLLVLFIFEHLQNSYQISSPSDPTYNAGVVEFAASRAADPKDRVRFNLNRMKEIIESNEAVDLDILVFPEFVLNNFKYMTYVPNPEWKIAPCDIPDYDNFLIELSCAARSRKLYVVVNVIEKENCGIAGFTEKCDASGLNKYNTNVVFDRHGRVISRYRKTHLYGSEWSLVNVRSKPELATFSTDFGVTFGHFICFDMLFYEPALLLVREHNITDLIYPTFWFSELPFLTGVQLQEGWAFANDINLLAAGGSAPGSSVSGSGIYAGKFGRLQASIFEDATTTLMKARVPKRNRHSEYQMPPITVPEFMPQLETKRLTKLKLLRDYNVDIFNTKLMDEDFITVNETLCHGKFCCHFDIRRQLISSTSTHSAYRYRLMAYEGNQTTFQRKDSSELAVCAVVACTNEELYSCGHIFPESVLVGNKYYFVSISVNGAFRNTARRAILPSTVDGALMPLPVSMYDWREEKKIISTEVTITLKSPKSDLLTFGIWTNHYSHAVSNHNLDSPIIKNKSISINAFSKFKAAVLLVACLWTHSMY